MELNRNNVIIVFGNIVNDVINTLEKLIESYRIMDFVINEHKTSNSVITKAVMNKTDLKVKVQNPD